MTGVQTCALPIYIEWFALETNRNHSVVFEIASKYCISDSFVDYDGYSISSKGFLPTVVDIMVIWVKFICLVPFRSLITKMSTFHSCHLLFDHFQFASIHGPNIPGSYAILLFTASDLASISSHIHNWVLFLRLHPSAAFWTLLLTMMATPFLLRDSCPQ